MATPYISPSTIPLHITPLKTAPAPPATLVQNLSAFLSSSSSSATGGPSTHASATGIPPEVAYQLAALLKNVQWQVEGHVDSLPVAKGAENAAMTGETRGTAATAATLPSQTPKKKKAKKAGSKWA
ncbi:hypothetical protein HDU86_008200 [Geranomyces michiganensis]|nr:hypothetical protein HDU86_008200 [Geranomyces michiganensis]